MHIPDRIDIATGRKLRGRGIPVGCLLTIVSAVVLSALFLWWSFQAGSAGDEAPQLSMVEESGIDAVLITSLFIGLVVLAWGGLAWSAYHYLRSLWKTSSSGRWTVAIVLTCALVCMLAAGPLAVVVILIAPMALRAFCPLVGLAIGWFAGEGDPTDRAVRHLESDSELEHHGDDVEV